jgi:hypothetical protein
MFKEFSEFDLASALYHWLQHNWVSQTDPLYGAFCVLTEPGMYRPSRSEEFFENIEDDAKLVYDMLTRDNYEDALNKVVSYESEDD